MEYERVTAEEIRAGDRVARARTHGFQEVQRVELHASAVSIYYVPKGGDMHRNRRALVTGGKDRPRRTAKWWREVPSS